MQIEIIGADSLGVRSLCTQVRVGERRIVIDPGVALDAGRARLLPHPRQVAAAENIRDAIIAALESATDVVISHYHGDHTPLCDADCYQLPAQSVIAFLRRATLWTKGRRGLTKRMFRRRKALVRLLGSLPDVDDSSGDVFEFSVQPHGERDARRGMVLMTRVASFVHASDIQLLDRAAVEKILSWEPDIVLAAGPPLYLSKIPREAMEDARRLARLLAQEVDTLILDHHLLRSEEGEAWLEDVGAVCAADFMKTPRRLLEAQRKQLYQEHPVPRGWHQDYRDGKATTEGFRP
jgi:predicted metallo-beta-lactamase superfamily hydrolase